MIKKVSALLKVSKHWEEVNGGLQRLEVVDDVLLDR